MLSITCLVGPVYRAHFQRLLWEISSDDPEAIPCLYSVMYEYVRHTVSIEIILKVKPFFLAVTEPPAVMETGAISSRKHFRFRTS